MFAGAGCGVVTVGGGAIVVVAIGRRYGYVFALANGGVVGVGGAAIVVVAIGWWYGGMLAGAG